VNPYAVRTMKEVGMDISGEVPKCVFQRSRSLIPI
jgi:hypothetical protein